MNKKKGFTFIELIIAVTIFSIIAVSIYSVFRAGVRLWSRTNPLIQANQSTRYFFNTISKDLKNSVSYNAVSPGVKTFGSSDEKKANFEGDEQRISFMTLVDVSGPTSPPHTELARVVYSFDRSKNVVKRAVATKAEGLSEDHAKYANILNNIDDKDFGFEYCYKVVSSPKEYEYEWKDTWSDEDKDKGKIPRGVRVKAGAYSKTIFIPTGRLGGKDGD
ncbi:MAG: prepilin-type N-terminal cleavage/methylation domain-containing protein [Candidatus Omnitrophota bacterium]|nr:prepilin-type N-terminal cleavage/methylation domain-containing protein [Candidatus Omnitrophota bacterium]